MLRRLLAALGAVAAVVAGCGSTTHPDTTAPPLTAPDYYNGTQASTLPTAGLTMLKSAPAAADAVAQAWVRSAVGRRDLRVSWGLTSSRWQKLYTRAEWLTGDIPVPLLYPSSVVIDRLKVIDAFTRGPRLTIQYWILGHDPKILGGNGKPADSKTKSFVDLVQQGKDWRVDFYSPNSPPPPGKVGN